MAENLNEQSREANLQRVRELGQEAMLGSGKMFETEIDYTSDLGTKIKGRIVFKRPNTGDMMKMAGLKTMFIQRQFLMEDGTPIQVDPMLIDGTLLSIAEVVANLQIVITQVDDSLKFLLTPEECDEMDVLFHVYGRYQAWRRSFRRPDSQESGKAD